MRRELTGPLGAEGRGWNGTKQAAVYQDCGVRGTWGRDLRPLTTWSKEGETDKNTECKKQGKGLGKMSQMRGDPRPQSQPQRPRRSRWSCRRRESKQKHDSPCYGTQKNWDRRTRQNKLQNNTFLCQIWKSVILRQLIFPTPSSSKISKQMMIRHLALPKSAEILTVLPKLAKVFLAAYPEPIKGHDFTGFPSFWVIWLDSPELKDW